MKTYLKASVRREQIIKTLHYKLEKEQNENQLTTNYNNLLLKNKTLINQEIADINNNISLSKTK
jgi:hypothetical protein